MFKKLKALLMSLVLILSSVSIVVAQQTEAYRGEELPYYEALALMNHRQYEGARKNFSDYLAKNTHPNSELNVNASYYFAFCTMQLFHRDAEFLMEEFLLKHPGSTWVEPAQLELGNYNFNRRDYEDALFWFDKIDTRGLTTNQQDEVIFKKGFSAFQLDKYDLAKANFFQLKDKEGVFRGPTNYYYGHIAYTEGNYQTALVSLNIAAEDPNFAPVVPYYITQIYHYQKKYPELIEYATPLPNSDEALRIEEIAHLVGDAYFQQQKYAEALPYLEHYAKKTRSISPDDAYQIGYTYYRTANYEKAVDWFAKAAKSENRELAQIATYQMADAYVKLGEKKYAQNAFKVASRLDADREVTEDALFNYAKLAYELSYDPFHEAIQAFEEYLEKYPNSERKDEAYEFLLKVHLATKNYQAAIESLNKMKSMDFLEKALYQKCAYNLGINAMSAHESEKAFLNFRLSQEYPQDPKLVALANYWMGDLYYRSGEYDKAVASYKTYLSNPSAYQTDYYNTANYNIGYCEFKNDNYAAALASFRKFVSGKNVNSRRKDDAYLRIGDLNLVAKGYNQAIDGYQKALNSGSNNADYARFQIAKAYGYQDQYQQKVNALNKLLQEHPETTLGAVAKYELGDSYFMLNKLDKALKAFNSVINDYQQSPYRKKALLKRGLVQYRKGDYDGAIASYKTVVADYGVDSESNEAVATLKNIYLDLGKVDEYSNWLSTIPNYEVSANEIDSLSYQAVENLVADGNCEKAIPEFEKYLRNYPTGLFVLNANYYLAQCAYRQNDYEKALKGFEYVIARPINKFSEPALQGAATIRFNREDFDIALEYYQKLAEVASFATNVLEAETGVMRSAFELDKYDLALAAADEVINNNSRSETELTEARLTKGRIYFTQKNYTAAQTVFEQLAKKKNSKSGAEAKFRLAQINYLANELDASEKQIFELIQDFSNYNYWKVKGFLLLSDVYLARNDFFQARATLQSVLDNVTDKMLHDIAEIKMKKLDAAEQESIQKSDTIQSPDTLDYEEQYQELIDKK